MDGTLGKYGEQIHAFIEAKNGAVICPMDELEMAKAPDAYLFYCGSGNFGDGHWISAKEVVSGDA